MADTPSTWADMGDEERDDALFDALVSGVSAMMLAEKLGARPLAVVRHLGSPRFQAKARAELPTIYLAAKLVADFLQPAQLLTAKSGKDGIGHKEFVMLTDKFGQFKPEEPVKDTEEERKVQAALAALERENWKVKQLFTGPKAEA